MELIDKIKNKQALGGLMRLGYLCLSLVFGFCEVGFPVLGFDTDGKKVELLNQGLSYIQHIPAGRVAELIRPREQGRPFTATQEMERLREADIPIICVPTPLTPKRGADPT